MKTNMLILVLPSLVAFALLCVHMVKTKGWSFLVYFVSCGLLFGFIRARVIAYIQVDINHSFIPYQFAGKLLRIGNDSLVVYLGWIIVAYIGWQLSVIIINNLDKSKRNQLFPIVSLSFFIIAALSYANETAASLAGWWEWNQFLTAGYANSVFINVPWVGIVDWATVSFEFLALFLVLRIVIKEKKWQYLLILLLPIIHWVSHINTFSARMGDIVLTPANVIHVLLPLVALFLWFVGVPKTDIVNKGDHNRYLYGALFIIILTCAFTLIYYGRDASYFVSLVPITTLILLATLRIDIRYLYSLGLLVLAGGLLIGEPLGQKRLFMALFPIVFLATTRLLTPCASSVCMRIRKQRLLSLAVLIICIFIGIGFLQIDRKGKPKPARENPKDKIILITLDTVPASHVGVYGSSRNATANLDIFSQENTLYKNAYSPIPYTYPAHYSLFTGLYPKETEVTSNINKLNDSQNLSPLAELFSYKGYETSAFISSHILSTDAMKKGFRVFDSGDTRPSTKPEERGVVDTRQSVSTNKVALSWIEANKDKGFFTWIHYYDPHSPYRAACVAPDYTKGITPGNKDFLNGDIFDQAKANTPVSQNDLAYLAARYDQDLYCTDKALGELLEKLKALSIYDEATIIVAGDHGENFDHGTIFHGDNLYESAVKIPMAVKSPRISKGVVDRPISLIDIYPTLDDLFKLTEFRQTKDGTSLASGTPAKRTLYFQTTMIEPTKQQIAGLDYSMTALLQASIKLIANKDKTIESYDISRDPLELVNLSIDNALYSKLKDFFPPEN